MIQVHLFSDTGPHSAVFESVESKANVFFSEQAIDRVELVSCQLAIAGGNYWSEAALLVVVDVEERITEADVEEALEEAVKLGSVERRPV